MSDLTKEIDGYVRFFAETIKDRYRTDAKGNPQPDQPDRRPLVRIKGRSLEAV